MPSLYERYVPLTHEKPVPTLAETRDRAIAENVELRQVNAELRDALRLCVTRLEFADKHIDCTAELLRARALLTKVSR